MRSSTISRIAQGVELAMLIAGLVLVVPNQASAQGAGVKVPCTVNYLRLRITTGGDDLRGWDGMSTSKDNLNVTIYFGKQGSQLAADVNKDQVWQNHSMHLVEIKLNQAVPLDQIRGIKLEHTGSSGPSYDAAKGSTPLGPAVGIQSPDTWDMQSLEVTAVGEGAGATILQHGPRIFTNGDRVLSTRVQIPANSCGVGERFGRLNLADKMLQKSGGAGSKYGQEPAHSTIQVAPRVSPQQLQNNRLIKQALAHTVQIGPRAGAPGGNSSYSAIIAIIKRQSLASRSLVTSSVRPPNQNRMPIGGSGGASQSDTLINPGTNSSLNPQPPPPKGSSGTLLSPGTTTGLNPQPLPPKGSTPMLGAGQTMSASGTQSRGASASPTATKVSGPRQQQPLTQRIGTHPMPTQICRTGIATVDGAANGVWFSPVAGEDGRFVIQGCGFGSMPGEVYLSGVQFDPAHAKLIVQHLGAPNSPDRVNFTIPPNEWKGSQQFVTSWSDRQIVAQIDANVSGLYDTNNVALNVKTASGQRYQATGMNFLAAREDQVLKKLVRTNYPTGADSCYGLTLSECLVPGINLAIVNASPGPLTPQVESPTHYWLTPGESIAVVRGVIYLSATDDYSLTLPNGTDTYQFNLAPGFQLDPDPNKGVQLNHASMDISHCQSLGGVYSHSGNWGVSYTSTSSFQVHWEEEACSPGSGAKSPQGIGTTSGYAGFSAYELEITVIGPRGINPLASGNGNGLAIKQLQPVQMLHKN